MYLSHNGVEEEEESPSWEGLTLDRKNIKEKQRGMSRDLDKFLDIPSNKVLSY